MIAMRTKSGQKAGAFLETVVAARFSAKLGKTTKITKARSDRCARAYLAI